MQGAQCTILPAGHTTRSKTSNEKVSDADVGCLFGPDETAFGDVYFLNHRDATKQIEDF